MSKKILAVICLITVSLGTLALASQRPTNMQQQAGERSPVGDTPGQARVTPGTRQAPGPAAAPEHIVYRQFFHHLVQLKERAQTLERQGKSGKALRSYYKDKAGLNDDQSRLLNEIAADCEREVAQMDAKAKKIIDALKARFPDGKVPAGQQLPPPPPALKKMQEQRDMIILRARHRLSEAMGSQGFQQLNDFIKLNVAPKVTPAQLQGSQRAASQPGSGMPIIR